MNAATSARERQLDWLLEEVLGGAAERARRPVVGARRETRLFAAALIALAACAALGVALSTGERPPAPAQDPASPIVVARVEDLDRLPAGVRELSILGCTDAAMAELARFTKLERLDLGRPIIDERGVAHRPTVTDAGLAHLARLRNLRALHLTTCEGIEGPGLAVLEDLPGLDYLDLTATSVESAALERLPRLPSLTSLNLAFCTSFHGRSLAAIATIPQLRWLSLRGCSTVTAADAMRLAAARQLRHLDLRDCQGRYRGQTSAGFEAPAAEPPPPPPQDGIGVTDASIAALAKLPLEGLLLGGCESLTDAIGDTLASLPALRQIDLANLPRTTGALLAKVPARIEALALDHNHQFTDAALRLLPPLPNLRELGLNGITALTDGGLAALLEGRRLSALRLGGVSFLDLGAPTPLPRQALTPASARTLANQPSLQRLDFSFATWLDAGALRAIAVMPSLSHLDLTGTSVCGGRALEPFGGGWARTAGAEAAPLRSLKLSHCKALDAEGLGVLAGARLHELDVYGTNLRSDDVRAFAAKLPGCTITLPDGRSCDAP